MKIMKILLFGILISSLSIIAQDWQSFNTDNSGLPSNAVKAVCVEPSGVKWFGTDAGLVRYDGSEWRLFTQTEDQQTLADNQIQDIAFEMSSYGPEIWVGTMNGVTILDVDGFTFATPYRTDNRPLLSNQINAVAVDSNHVKWFATDMGVSIFDGNNWRDLTQENKKLVHDNVFCIGVDNECDSLWRYFGTSGRGVSRIYHHDLDGITKASAYDSDWTIMISDSILAFHVIHQQKHWIGSTLGVYEHDSTETKRNWNMYTTYEGLVHDVVHAIAEGQDGTMWFGTGGGISHFVNGQFDNYTTSDGLAGNVVYDIAMDHDGSLWFATDGGVTHLTNISDVANQDLIPETSQLISNYPNPFNPSTHIKYELAQGSFVQLVVYDVSGQEVKRLVNEIQAPNSYQVSWNGTDQLDRSVAAGVYIAKLSIKGTEQIDSVKMLLIK
ncbi:two-component regulator propeller domain-containing protein [bacterium]